VTALIGEGGMGRVWRAHHAGLKRDDALKVLPEAFLADPERLARFQREAQVLASLNHPNIAHVYGLENADGMTALVMELVEGPTLAERIARGPVPLDEALPIAKQIAEALETAHERGIVHRDLKPANIKLTSDGMVKVLDFGIAKMHAPDGAGAELPTVMTVGTRAGMVLGTAAYMSPEQARGQAVDKRSDIWAFGCVVFEMLAGRIAFAGDTDLDRIAAILDRQPEWSVLPAATPIPIRRLLRRCLAKNVSQRLADIRDGLLEIDDARTGHHHHKETLPAARPRLERLAWVAAVVLGATIGAVATWTARSTISSPDPIVARFDVQTPPTEDATSFALSPDGRHLVFVANTEAGDAQLWLRSLDRTSARPLPGTTGATFPFWKPDSQEVGFFADGKLRRIDINGGVPQDITDVMAGRGASWNVDDIIIFANAATDDLYRVPAAGGSSSAVVKGIAGQPGLALRWPQFLPDNNQFLFYGYLARQELHGIYVASVGGGEPVRRGRAESGAVFVPPNHLLLLRQGRLIALPFDWSRPTPFDGDGVRVVDQVGFDAAFRLGAFSASWTGLIASRAGSVAQRRQLVWFDPEGRELSKVGSLDLLGQANPELNRDGRSLLLNRTVEGNIDVYRVDVNRGAETRLTTDESSEVNPLWSPGQTRVTYQSNRNGVYDIFEQSASGGGDERELLGTPDGKTGLSWSADGKFLLYSVVTPENLRDLWALTVDVTTGNVGKSFLVVGTPYEEHEGQISPDGRWVAYTSNVSGRQEVYVQPFPDVLGPGETVTVSIDGGAQIRWRHDSKGLYYVAPDSYMMAVMNAATSEGKLFEPTKARPLFRTRLARGINIAGTRPQYVVARDGRFLMNVRAADPTPSPITILQNWTALLKRSVQNR